MPNTLYVNPGFRRGLVDPWYRHAAALDDFSISALTLKNFVVRKSGAVTRRPRFEFLSTAYDADWSISDANADHDNTEAIFCMPFQTPTRQLIVVVQKGANGNELEVDALDVATQDWRPFTGGGRPLTLPVTSFWKEDLSAIQYTQAGSSLFFTHKENAGLFGGGGPGYVCRVYEDSSGDLHAEFVEFHHELAGTWSHIAVADTDPGTIELTDKGTLDGTTPTDGDSPLINYTDRSSVEDELEVGDEFQMLNSNGNFYWEEASALGNAAAYYNVEFTATSDTKNFIDAYIKFRKALSGTNLQRYQRAGALAFFEGRFFLGNISNEADEVTKLLISASNDFRLIYPSVYNERDDGPINVVPFPTNLDRIVWMAGTRNLVVAGQQGVIVVAPNVTQALVQTLPVDSVGAYPVQPSVDRSGITYIAADQKRIVHLRYDFNIDSPQPIFLNDWCIRYTANPVSVATAPGFAGMAKAVFVPRSNGQLAVGQTDDDMDMTAWSLFDTELGAIEQVITFGNGDVFVVVNDEDPDTDNGNRVIMKLVEDDDYVGDVVETAAVDGNGDFYVSNAALKSVMVAVVATKNSDQVHLGLFETTASGYIQDEEDNKLADMFTGLSNVTVFRPFDSVLKPTPPLLGTREGQGLGQENRLVDVSIGCIETRAIRVNDDIFPTDVALNAEPDEIAATNGFFSVTPKSTWSLEGDVEISAHGAYQCTITSIVRKVSA